jgi:hypothetical protein
MRRVKYIRTNEDWYPSLAPLQKAGSPDYNNPLDSKALIVRISDFGGVFNWHVSVWGGDDFGMEKWGLSRKEANRLYTCIRDYTTKTQLKYLGLGVC